jgi:outer membrane murein-binding lipoprotein Lpp
MGLPAQEDLNAEQDQVQTDLNNMATEQAGHLTGARE